MNMHLETDTWKSIIKVMVEQYGGHFYDKCEYHYPNYPAFGGYCIYGLKGQKYPFLSFSLENCFQFLEDYAYQSKLCDD